MRQPPGSVLTKLTRVNQGVNLTKAITCTTKILLKTMSL